MSIGVTGEDIAVAWLIQNGFRLKDRNFKRKFGEIDIVAEKNGVLHFIEVKTSEYVPGSGFSPEIRVNRRKAAKLKNTSREFLRQNKIPADSHWKIDVISVTLLENGSAKDITHYENAIFERSY